MPRDLSLGNGQFLVAFDLGYEMRDVHFPDVGSENHGSGGSCRLGVRLDERLTWFDEAAWELTRRYEPATMLSAVTLRHDELELEIRCTDGVDFHRNVLIRRFELHDLAGRDRRVQLFYHQGLRIGGYAVGDTVFYEPRAKAICHYKKDRWFLLSGQVGDRVGPAGFNCARASDEEGQEVWRDAEDGRLEGEAIAEGEVDSIVLFEADLPAGGQGMVHLWLAAGSCRQEVGEIDRFVRRLGADNVLDRTRSYWRLWVEKEEFDYDDLPPAVADLFQRSLLILRTHIDQGGGIVAANGSDLIRRGQDLYSYIWPRDAAFAAMALIDARYNTLAGRFFEFCARVMEPEGYLLHKFNPDGTLASTWLPWVDGTGREVRPIQEDETAVVLWALWHHFDRFRDVEFIKPLYAELIKRGADFLLDFRDPVTGLPLPSWDLWEERRGVHTFTVAAVIAGLEAAMRFARAFGDEVNAERYQQAAEETRQGLSRHLFDEASGQFARSGQREEDEDGGYRLDLTVDAANYGLFRFGILAPDDPRLAATMEAIEAECRVRTEIGGLARYPDDPYRAVAEDDPQVPGNPWFVCTLWLAEWRIAKATSAAELAPARESLEWCVARALPSGVMAEQIHPYTGEPLSVSPLMWSHATFVSTVIAYLRRKEEFGRAAAGGPYRHDRGPGREGVRLGRSHRGFPT